MRIIDALSAPTTLAPGARIPRGGNGDRAHHRFPLTILLLIDLVCLYAIAGCAAPAVSESRSADRQPPVEMPMTIRTLSADRRFSQLSSATMADRLRATLSSNIWPRAESATLLHVVSRSQRELPSMTRFPCEGT